MKKVHVSVYMLAVLLSVSASLALNAQDIELIDVNKVTNANPINLNFSTAKQKFALLNRVSYFAADDGIHGVELWRSNGTAEGTMLVKDIYSGAVSSFPRNIIVSAGNVYFTTVPRNQNSTPYIEELWVSDGTSEGSYKLVDINNSFSQHLTDVNGVLYFINNQSQLWKTDGTKAGTLMVVDLSFLGKYNPRQLVNVNGTLFFVLDDNFGAGSELYKSDGTPEGTVLVKDINPNFFAGSNPTNLTVFKGKLYFAADDGTGNKLWVSDGTDAGTHAVNNRYGIYLPLGYGYALDPFTTKNNILYFQGYTDEAGYELCRYNTSDTSYNVRFVKDIISGEKSSYPSNITNVKGTLFFTIGPAGGDAQLWKSDGTTAGTQLVKTINPGGPNYYSNLFNNNGTLLFNFYTPATGTELWKSDGTAEGTTLVKDIFPGVTSSYPHSFTYNNGFSFFNAYGRAGSELWRSDGTEAGTQLVKDINYTSTSSSSPAGFAALPDGKVVFSAYDGINPGSLNTTDGTAAGTKHINDSAYVQLGFQRQTFVTLHNTTYFLDWANRLWKTDGTKAGTSILPIPPLTTTGYVLNMLATEDVMYIFVYDYTTFQNTLWRSDGTARGTYILKSDISASYSLSPTIVGNYLFFTYFDNFTFNIGLWKTDGTVEGTVMVKAIPSSNFNPLANLFSFNGKLYFAAYTPANFFGPSLWTSDGTEAGTYVVKEVAVGPQLFAKANGKMFFYALDAISKGYELFATNGTAAGTRIVKDINKGAAASNDFNSVLVSGDTVLYFTANDGKRGTELWRSNGTGKGTKLVRDITRGVNSSFLTNMVNVKDHLFFTINDTLWYSNGTRQGTTLVRDATLDGVTQLQWLTAIGDKLYFSGYTYATGYELYVGSIENEAAVPSIPDNIVTRTLPAGANVNETGEDGTIANVVLSPNPATNTVRIAVTGFKQGQPSTITLLSASGTVLKTIQASGTTQNIQLDVSSLASGVYTIRLVSGGKVANKPFVKL